MWEKHPELRGRDRARDEEEQASDHPQRQTSRATSSSSAVVGDEEENNDEKTRQVPGSMYSRKGLLYIVFGGERHLRRECFPAYFCGMATRGCACYWHRNALHHYACKRQEDPRGIKAAGACFALPCVPKTCCLSRKRTDGHDEWNGEYLRESPK